MINSEDCIQYEITNALLDSQALLPQRLAGALKYFSHSAVADPIDDVASLVSACFAEQQLGHNAAA